MMFQSAGKVGIRFGAFHEIKKFFPNNPILCGSIAGSLEALLWITPCERVKVLIIKHSKENHPMRTVVGTLYKGGLAQVYRGALPTVVRNGGSIGIRLALFEKINPTIKNAALSGALVGAFTTVLNNPIDVIKSTIQSLENSQKCSTIEQLRLLIKTNNFKSLLFTGLAARMFKISLGQAVIFQTVESLKDSD